MSRNRQITLAVVLFVVLGALIAYDWPRDTQNGATPARAGRDTSGRQSGKDSRDVPAVPPVKMDKLAAAQHEKEPAAAERNPFTFQAPRLPGAIPGGRGGVVAPPAPPVNPVPPPPPPPPPITLKFIGVAQWSGQKVAVLSDATTHDVFYGREGDIIDGRYRILRIAVESVDMAYVDGRGRQSIRLSGS